MNFFIKKYQKSSLAFISIALLSASSLALAKEVTEVSEFNTSKIKLCQQSSYLDINKEYMIASLGSEAAFEEYYQQNEPRLGDSYKAQTFVSVFTHLYSYHLEPRILLSEAVIYDFSTGVYNYDQKEVPRESGSFGASSSLAIRSFGKDQFPGQILGGRSTISGPGVHYQKTLVARLGELPPPTGSRAGCKNFNDTTW